MKILSNLREFFWPLLEKSVVNNPIEYSIEQINVNDNLLKETLDISMKIYEQEEERRKTVETKSSLFIGIVSVVISIIIGVTSILVKETEFNDAVCFLVLTLTILTIYLSRTVWFSIKSLERNCYETLGPEDYILPAIEKIYYKKLICVILNKIQINSITINKKVDNMVMAQEYFKRAIGTIVLYAIALFILYIMKSGGLLENMDCLC